MGTKDERKNFIDDDIFVDNIEEKINELYERTRQIEEINKNTPESDNEILRRINEYYAEFGTWDTAINGFVETDAYRCLEGQKDRNNGINPFNRKYIRNMIRTQFDGDIDDDKELIACMIRISNRMSKIPEMIMSKIGWDETKKRNLKYILVICKVNGYDYSNGELNKKIFEEVSNDSNVTYDEFELYSKLDYCKNIFYKIKHNKINQGIENGLIEDYTYLDISKSSEMDLYRNLRIDVPGYIYPDIFHVKKDDYKKDTGIDIDKQKMVRCDEKIQNFPILNFKMNEEQRNYIKKLKEDKAFFVDEPFFEYLLNSVLKYENQKLKEERRRKRLEQEKNDNETSETNEKNKNNIIKSEKKKELDNKMYEHLLTMCEGVTNSERLNEYKQQIEKELKYDASSRNNILAYNRVRKYVEYLNETENRNYTEEQKENETANIYVYMKMCDLYVRNCMSDKDNQGYMKKAYDSYKLGFVKFKESVQNGKSVNDIKNDVKYIKKTIRKPKVKKTNEVEKEETPKTKKKKDTSKVQDSKEEKKAKRPYTRKITGNKPIHEYSNKDISEKNSEMQAEIDKMDEKITYNTARVELLKEHARLAAEIKEKEEALEALTAEIWRLEEAFLKNTKEERNK